MMTVLNDTLTKIAPVDETLSGAIQAHLDDLTKPQGSLGLLEAVVTRYCKARNTASPATPTKRIVCFGADHGVCEEGISAFPAEVTPQMVMNMLGGGAAINAFTKHVGSDLVIVDMGVNDPLSDAPDTLKRCKIRSGTGNIAKGPAMTEAEAQAALEAGINLANEAAADGITLLGSGDMGIGNTTPSTALYCALLGCEPRDITGPGTGLDAEGVHHKVAVIEQALEINKERLTSPLSTLAAVGGLEIAGIAGLILGGAANRIPIVVDGFISTAGAVVALALCPAVKDYLLFSHMSKEPGHAGILAKLQAEPLLDLGLRLGEGTGAALAMSLIDASIKFYTEMATFSGAGVSDSN
jgi:nicotinate-nucleotide--dimethylbenzimidazole phosphoribosyltransferase